MNVAVLPPQCGPAVVRAANGAGLVDRVIVATAVDDAAVLALLDAVAPEADVVVILPDPGRAPTSADIDAVAAEVLYGRADSAFAAAPAPERLWRKDGSGLNHVAGLGPEPALIEAGSVYAVRVADLRRHRHRFAGRVRPVPTTRSAPSAPAIGRGDLDALVLDFGGTLTDDRVIVDQDGRESVVVHRGDGLGIAALRRSGLDVLILSSERSPIVAARARRLEVPALYGIADKGRTLGQWCADNGHAPARTGYLGNDVDDLPCLDLVGWPMAVADAHPDVRARARLVTTAAGGRGAAREIAALLLREEITEPVGPLALLH